MTSRQKTWTTALWGALVLGMVGVISAGLLRPTQNDPDALAKDVHASADPALSLHTPVPSFSLIDENGNPFTDQSLHGSVHVAQFIFTHCAGPCQMISAKFTQLQKQLDGSPVKLLSVSVDPDRDTPAALTEWGQQFHADFSRWTFLTGDKATVYAVARSMLMNVIPATADSPLMHSTKFVLIDKTGTIREIIDSHDDDALGHTAHDAIALQAEPDR